MKNISFPLLFLFMVSCSSENVEPQTAEPINDEVSNGDGDNGQEEETEQEQSSLLEGKLVFGVIQDENGNYNKEPYQYRIPKDQEESPLVHLYQEIGVPEAMADYFYISTTGITAINNQINPDKGYSGLFPYYKNFEFGVVNGFGELTTVSHLKNYGDHNGDVYAFYSDYESLDESNNSYDYFLKIIDSGDLTERVLNIGQFSRNGEFRIKKSGKFLYVYYALDYFDPANASLIVIDLDALQIVDRLDEVPEQPFKMVRDDLGNCYFFSVKINLKYDISLKSLIVLDVPGDTIYLPSIYSSPVAESIISNDILYSSTVGAQSGANLFYPLIYNLKTGEKQFFDFYDEVTQFADDTYEWRPLHKSLTYNVQEKVFYLGVSSDLRDPQFSSDAIFVVDMDGKVLEKRKLPFKPIKFIDRAF